jgi:sugar O-acyltransferase (sialic acid O-acetyltransferase NeuD family)
VTAQPLLLLGAGGLAREVLAAVREMPGRWDPIGALDDDPGLHGARIDGLPVLGGFDLVHEYESTAVVACVANPRRPAVRTHVVERLGLGPERWATIVHPAASIPPAVVIGHGSVLLAGVVVTAPQVIGHHVLAMPHVLLTHDNQVDDYVTLAGRVTLGGGVRLRQSAYLGQGALLREHVQVGEAAVIGMGSVVLSDVPAGEVWAGVPAKQVGRTGAAANHASPA